MHWGEGRGIEYLDPVKQAESDRIAARMRFTETSDKPKRPQPGGFPWRPPGAARGPANHVGGHP